MEDFFNGLKYDTFDKIKYDSGNITLAIKDIANILEETKRNDFKLLCAIRTIIKESSHGGLILSGEVVNLKYSWVSKEYTVLTILEKCFGFCEKYVCQIARVINKFLVIKTQNDVVLEKDKDNSCAYIYDFLNDLTISKLIELLPLSNAQIMFAFESGELNYMSTVKQIREYVKLRKSCSCSNDDVEESSLEDDLDSEDNIPAKFNPLEKHDRKFYADKNKNELIYICMEFEKFMKKYRT